MSYFYTIEKIAHAQGESRVKDISSVLVAGAGAIGSMVAFQIFKKKRDAISILAGGERLQRYIVETFEVNGEKYHFPLTDVASNSAPDLVIIACKFHHLDQILLDLKNHIGPETLIISLLNGISSEEIIGKAYGENRIPYAMILGTDAGHAENRTVFSKTGTIYFGDAENGAQKSSRVLKISSFFDSIGISYTVPENMLNRLWFKFMMNVGINQVTAILRRPYGIFKKNTLVREASILLDCAMREVITIAACEGITLGDGDVETVYRTLDLLADDGKTSMHQDVEAGRKTEVELFSGTMIELGKKHSIPVPINEMLYFMLTAIEKSY